MRRISSAMTNGDIQANLRRQEYLLNKANNQLSSQTRITNLRDDPIAAGHLVRYQSYAARVNQFEKNSQALSEKLTVAEGYMNQSVDIMQRVRELAVQGANSIYTKEDLSNMAVEVNELLKELVENANALGPDGTSLFGGTSTNKAAYEVETGPVKGASTALITNVKFNGSINNNKYEIDEQTYMDINQTGNRIFWAENQILYTQRDASSFQVKEQSIISIDGQEIKLNAGDNVYSVISKINNSGVAVKASVDPVTNGLNIATTDAHQLWLDDIKGSVFADLGVINDNSQRPPYNLNASTRVSGGSLFDSVIALRDAMIQGDIEAIGSQVLNSIDGGIDTLVTRLAETGSLYERAQNSIARAQTNDLNVTSMISREGDLDFTKAITDMKMLEYVQQASLSQASKMYQSSMLNYMK